MLLARSAPEGEADEDQLATGEAFEGIDFGGWGTPSGVCSAGPASASAAAVGESPPPRGGMTGSQAAARTITAAATAVLPRRRSDSPFGFLTFAASRNNQVSDSYNRIRTIRHQVIGSSGKCGLRGLVLELSPSMSALPLTADQFQRCS